ncbi:MAG TPA: IPT/TIG domain-containing protein [Gaiellaceae bacterium]|nr:IPT/TIG domain-containing protein [Gaiellaceae bacterium]
MKNRTILCGAVCLIAMLAFATTAFAAGMKPAVKHFMPMSAAEGATVTITGADLTGVTSVKFGGVATMHFKVLSATKITAVVPMHAKKGAISVTTSAGTGHTMDTFTPKM